MYFLIGIIILILFIIFTYLYFTRKFKKLSRHYFGTTDLSKIIEQSKIADEETIKSLGSMDSIYLNNLEKDFPNLNLNELKRLSESLVLDVFTAISTKDEKIKSFVKAKIKDFTNHDLTISNLKIHKSVLNKYEKKSGIATIYLATAFEYYEKNGTKPMKKVQKRIKTEFIYIIDASKVKASLKSLGLNCPNCGAPLRNLGQKKCEYCNTLIVDLVKKSFILNDIIEY